MKRGVIASTVFGAFFMLQSAMTVLAANGESILIPNEYINADRQIKVLTDAEKDMSVKSVTYSINNGAYMDITDKLYFKVSDNCKVHVKIVYADKKGNETEKELSGEITQFDGEKPELSASIQGEILTIHATDNLSGVRLLNVNGKDFTNLTDGSIGVNVKELENESEYLTVYAKDMAGNVSSTYKIKNPYYVGEEVKNTNDQSVNNPPSVKPSAPTQATATVTTHTDDAGNDLTKPTATPTTNEPVNEGEPVSQSTSVSTTTPDRISTTKEFYTIQTDSDKTFYLVVDETQSGENVYLLTEVGENDLLNFVNYDGNKVDSGEVEMYSVSDGRIQKVEENEVEVVEEEKAEEPKEKKSSPLGIALITIIGGVFVYFFKFKKKDNDMEDVGDLDDYESTEEI